MLKQVEVYATFFPKGITDKGFILENESDFCDFFKREEDKLLSDFSAAVKSKMPTYQWDHIYGLLGFSTSIAKAKGSSPIIEASLILNAKETDMLRMIANGNKVFVNMNGGYHRFNDKTHTIIRYIGSKEEKTTNISIAKNPTLINLENDPMIEKKTKDFYNENKLELSTVVNLRMFDKSELINVFNEFHNAGGYGVYVYTTGSDLIQMKEYIDAVIGSKLNTLVIELNTELTKEIQEVFDYAKSNILDFKQL